MARPGFSIENNLSEASKGNTIVDNLLAGDSQPFSRDDLVLFRNNQNYATYLDWIPNNFLFSLTINSPDLSPANSRIDVQNISLAQPSAIADTLPGLGGIINLSVSEGDNFITSPLGHSPNQIVQVSKPDSQPDYGFFNLSSIIQSTSGIVAPKISRQDSVQIRKQNKANYSPGTGRFTFGNDLVNFYSNGDIINGIFLHGGRNTPFDLSPTSMYPLIVDSFRKDVNGQFSFVLKMSLDTPVTFGCARGDSPSRVNLLSTSPGGLYFTSPSSSLAQTGSSVVTNQVVRFRRKLPVSQNDFFQNAPPLFRATNGPESFVDLADNNKGEITTLGEKSYTAFLTGFEDLKQMYNINQAEASAGPAAFTESTVITYNTAIQGFAAKLELAESLVNTSIIKTRGNYYNDTEFQINVDGIVNIQDPAVVNSPRMYTAPGKGNQFVTNRLAPATYIQEDNPNHVEGVDDCPFLYRRAFSTFDGPWSNTPSAAHKNAAKIFTHGNTASHAEYVKDLSVEQLVFEDHIKLKNMSRDAIGEHTRTDVGASEVTSSFTHKMPIKVKETDPTTGELIDADYFLLLRQGISFYQVVFTLSGVSGPTVPATQIVFPTSDGYPIGSAETFTFSVTTGSAKTIAAGGVTVTGAKVRNIVSTSSGGGSHAGTFNLETQTFTHTTIANTANTQVDYTVTGIIGNMQQVSINIAIANE